MGWVDLQLSSPSSATADSRLSTGPVTFGSVDNTRGTNLTPWLILGALALAWWYFYGRRKQ